MKQFSKPMSIVLGFALLVAALSLVAVSLVCVPQDTRTPGEGWGLLTVREIGSGEEGSVRVYWDSTPPVAPFQSPRFNAPLDGSRSYQVIAHTLDEDIVSIKVTWVLATPAGRDIPRFEQHFLGFDFAQHAACVPTTVGANLQWLPAAGQAQVVNTVFANDNKKL